MSTRARRRRDRPCMRWKTRQRHDDYAPALLRRAGQVIMPADAWIPLHQPAKSGAGKRPPVVGHRGNVLPALECANTRFENRLGEVGQVHCRADADRGEVCHQPSIRSTAPKLAQFLEKSPARVLMAADFEGAELFLGADYMQPGISQPGQNT